MLGTNKTIQKFISTILVIAMLLPAFGVFLAPKKADAQFHDVITGIWTGLTSVFTAATKFETKIQSASTIKKAAAEITRQLIMVAVRRALQQLTKSTINYINTGHFGNPLFIENPSSFFRDIAKTEIKTFIEQTGYDSVRFPFGKQYALNTIDAFKSQFAENAQYTLSKATTDPVYLNNFQNDFIFGGWNGFLINTQFPQNNPVGYHMLATQKLARDLAGTTTNAANQIQNKVEQGLGFLSPQVCPSKPENTNLTNPFKKPSFNQKDYEKKNPYNPPAIIRTPEGYIQNIKERAAYEEKWLNDMRKAQGDFNEKYSCPEGFVDTTPGSVIASQVTNAMGTSFRQSELGAALGVSLSAVFDALINKWMNKGLTSLTSKVNQLPTNDDFSYYGNTLGSASTGGNNYSWDSGPDEEISVDSFKKQLRGKTIVLDDTGAVIREDIGNTGVGEYIPGDIANTTLEIRLMDNESASNPGITQLIGQIWPQIRALDMCLPGPDLGWEDRVIQEQDRNSQKIQEKSNDNDGEKAATAQLVYKSLQFAVGYFKDWINTKQMGSLPNAIIYQDAVRAIEPIYQENKELTDKRRARGQALARIQAIDASLSTFTSQPLSGTQKEKELITLRKQYNATKDDISNSGRVEDTRNQLSVNKDKLANLKRLVAQCKTERTAAGWANPGGMGSRYNPPTTPPPTATTFTPTVPTNTYVPTGIETVGYLGRTYNNGWYPSLSPNGRYVAFGNWGDSYVVDLESTTNPKQKWNFKNPPGFPSEAEGGGRCMAGQWLSNTKLTFVCEVGPIANGGRDGFWRYEVNVGEWVARKTNDDPNKVVSTIFRAEDNHWASYAAGVFRIAKDNTIIANNVGGAMSISGNTVVHACTNENQEICVLEGNVLTQTYTPQVPIYETATKNGYIIYGGYGPVHGITPNGNDVDLAVAPGFLLEGIGDLVDVNGVMWVVTNAWNNSGQSYILLRPWGSSSAIVITGGSVWTSVVYKGGNFLIAYNDDQGNVKILTVPANSPLQDIGGSSASTLDAPGTELELFCSRPIVGGYPHESFRTPNYSGGLSSFFGPQPTQNQSQAYKKIPLVNARDVLNWRSFWGTVGAALCLGLCGSGVRRVNIELNCNIIFKTSVIDYKKDLPGLTVDEPFVDLDAGAGPLAGCETCADKGQTDKYMNDLKSAARQALAELELTSPGIGDLPSYNAGDGGSDEGERAVAKLRDKTISILQTRGFDARKVASPQPYQGEYFYPQVISLFKTGDPDRTDYRITTGGSRIKDAIEQASCGGHSTLAGEDIIPPICLDPGATEEGAPAPVDAGTKHGNQASLVAQAKNTLASLGRTWVPDQPTKEEYECKRFEITNAAAKLIPGAGILEKTGGTNCRGYSVDIIVFADGYIYDVLSGGSPDGAGPVWNPAGCGPKTGNGTCPDKYRQPIAYP